MRNAVIGLIIGIVAGIVFGTTVIAPRLAQNVKKEIGLADADAPESVESAASTAEAVPEKNKQTATTATRIDMASAYA